MVEKFRLRNYNNELYLQPTIEKNLEVVEKDQDLQQVIELKLEDRSWWRDQRKEDWVDRGEWWKSWDENYFPVVLLKITTQFVDFLEIENYDFVFNPLLIDVANKLKANEKYFKSTSFKTKSSYWSIFLFGVEYLNFYRKTWGQVSFKWRGMM